MTRPFLRADSDSTLLGSMKHGACSQPLIRTVLFSTLFPSEARPGHGLFVEARLCKLLDTGQVASHVVAPVPWFPSRRTTFGDYALFARTPPRESRFGIDVLHPRYWLPPKVGMNVAPVLLALGALGTMRSLMAEGFDFDLIDAHYYYPDGVAAALLAAWLNKPFVMTARGSDLNVMGHYRWPARQMRWAARRAASNIAVSRSLADIIIGWGIEPSRVHVLRNGVDCERFQPVPVPQARSQLGVQGWPVLLTVGNLVPLKRQAMALETLGTLRATYPQATLLIVGEGPERANLQRRAVELGLRDRVSFAGAVTQSALSLYYSAADVLLLTSEREGWPNVVLESMACGTPVVAARVGGVPEIVRGPPLGELIEFHRSRDYAEAVTRLVSQPPSRADIRSFARSMDWEATSEGQLALFRAALGSVSR